MAETAPEPAPPGFQPAPEPAAAPAAVEYAPPQPPAPPSPPPEAERPARTSTYVVPLRHRAWVWLTFILALATAGWVFAVIWGENRNWSDDPGRWAALPTLFWAVLGSGVLILVMVFYLLLLVRREVPTRVYPIPGGVAEAPPPAAAPEAPQPPQPPVVYEPGLPPPSSPAPPADVPPGEPTPR